VAVSFQAASETDQVVLSESDKEKLAFRARRDLFRVLVAQFALTFLVALMFGLLSGLNSATSAMLGAFCYLVPNTVFVLRLVLATFKPQGAGAATFLIGNALKVLVTIGLLGLLASVEAGRLDWAAAIVGLIAALKGYWLGLLLSGGRLGK